MRGFSFKVRTAIRSCMKIEDDKFHLISDLEVEFFADTHSP
jgi:hypothetical protein